MNVSRPLEVSNMTFKSNLKLHNNLIVQDNGEEALADAGSPLKQFAFRVL